jgi:hypothetical protein
VPARLLRGSAYRLSIISFALSAVPGLLLYCIALIANLTVAAFVIFRMYLFEEALKGPSLIKEEE